MLFIPYFDTIYSELFYIWCRFMKFKVKNRSMQDMNHMDSYLQSFLPYAQKRMGFNRPPTIFFDSDPQNAENVLGKTGYYNPDSDEIVIFVDKRHPKDILRSLSHELVHHAQNCRGDLEPEIAGETSPGYAQTNTHMRNMESEAYELGSGLYFRDWEDSLKNQLKETNYKHITGDSHKMATYEQLKEEITAKVVASLTEKLTNKIKEGAKPDFLDLDGDGDKEEPMKKAAKEKDLKEEEGDLEERKKRDTPRDNTRLEPQKLKINEEDLEEGVFAPNHYCLHHGGVKHEGKIHMAEAVGHNWNEKEGRVTHYDMKLEDGTVLENVAFEDIQVTNASLAEGHHHPMKREDDDEKADKNTGMHGMKGDDDDDTYMGRMKERKKRDTPRDNTRLEPQKLKMQESAKKSDEKVVEESISNDEWYQNELFENLKKRWTK